MVFSTSSPYYHKSRTIWPLKRMCKNRVKLLAALVFIAFLVVCIGPIFFLPELRGGISSSADNVYKVYKKMQKAAPELIIPPPPPQDTHVTGEGFIRNHNGVHKKISPDENDIHVIEDKLRLQNN